MRAINDNLNINTVQKSSKWLAILLVIILGVVFISSHKAYAFDPGNDIPYDFLASPSNSNNLESYDTSGSSLCVVPPVQQEWQSPWISVADDPGEDGNTPGSPYKVTEAADGSISLSLQLNSLEFLCHTISNPTGNGINYSDGPYGAPYDGSPSPSKAYPYQIPYGYTSWFQSINLIGSGSLPNPPDGTILSDQYNSSSRYWFSKSSSFTYTNSLTPGLHTIYIQTIAHSANMWLQAPSGYSSPIAQCVGSPSNSGYFDAGDSSFPVFTNDSNGQQCPVQEPTFSLTIDVLPPPTATIGGSVDTLNSSGASDGDPKVGLQIYDEDANKYSGIDYETCNQDITGRPVACLTATTNANGHWSAQLPVGHQFSVEVTSGYPVQTFTGPYTDYQGAGTTAYYSCTNSLYQDQIARTVADGGSYVVAGSGCGTTPSEFANNDNYNFVFDLGGAKVTATCSISQTDNQIYQPFQLTATYTLDNGRLPKGSYITLTGTLPAGLSRESDGGTTIDAVGSALTEIDPTTTTTTGVIVGDSAGTYTFNGTATVTSNGSDIPSPIPCTGTIQLYQKPYLKVFGGDVTAGNPFDVSGTTCSSPPDPNSSAGIYSSDNQNSSSQYVGASTSAGAFATYLVSGFGSDNNSGSPPNQYTFSNSTTSSGFGGNFGTAYCIPDYYAELSSSANANVANNVTVVTGKSSLSNALGVLPGATKTLSAGTRYIILANGPFEIDANVDYDPNLGNDSPGSLTQDDYPLLYVIDKGGSMYVQSGIDELAGVYIDEPTSASAQDSNDTIYDCSSGATPIAKPFGGQCSSELVVDGSFMAGNIDFERTNGTQDQATNSQSSCSSINGKTGADTNAADLFCYTPITWLANPFSYSANTDYLSAAPPTL